MQQTWDPSLYAGNGRFVALLAESVVEALQPQPGERILDLGCGDGFLTRRIAESGATLVGVDSSPQMVAAAKERGVDARHAERGITSLRSGIRRRLFQRCAALDERSRCRSPRRASGAEAWRPLRGRMRRPGKHCRDSRGPAGGPDRPWNSCGAHRKQPLFQLCGVSRAVGGPGFPGGGNHPDAASDAAGFRDGRMARNLPQQRAGTIASRRAAGRHRADCHPA